jgi:hypothetical protein
LNKNKLIASISIMSFIIVLITALFSPTPTVQAATPVPITVVVPDGSVYTLSDITDPNTILTTIDWGGYKNTGSQLYSGIYQGVSLATICAIVGFPLQSYQNVTVQTSGGGGTNTTFNYDQAVNGRNLSPQYEVYDNTTGAVTTPSQPLTLIVAYQFQNGTSLPGAGTTSRLMTVGPQGILFQGPGLAGVISLNITNVSEPSGDTTAPTPTPTQAPPTTEPTVQPTSSVTTETPTASPTAKPVQNELPITYIAVAGIAIAVVVVAVVVILHGRKPAPV